MERIHQEIMHDALADPESKPNPLFKWFFVLVSAIILVTVLLAFLGGGQAVRYIDGRLQSDTITQNYYIVLDNGKTIDMPEDVYNQLVDLLTLENKEFKACLLGNKRGNQYIVEDVYLPIVYDNSFRHVTSKQCPPETIIPLHSHPIDSCIFSEQDLQSYEDFKKINPDALLGLMCGLNRFNFFENT